jgi:hypothetical protein
MSQIPNGGRAIRGTVLPITSLNKNIGKITVTSMIIRNWAVRITSSPNAIF